jgi:hypothetical protein
MKNQESADYFICSALGQILVELKGCDVEKGVRQIIASHKFLKDRKICSENGKAFLVCSRYPRHDTTIARAKRKLMKIGWPLKIFECERTVPLA